MGMFTLSEEVKQILITRFKSFAWRFCMVGLAFLLQYATETLDLLQMSSGITVIVGLALGEVSKYLNNKYDLEQYATLFPTKN